MDRCVRTFIAGRNSIFAAGVVATLKRGNYQVLQQSISPSTFIAQEFARGDLVLVLILRESGADASATCTLIEAVRERMPQSRIVVVQDEVTDREDNLRRSAIDGWIQGHIDPVDLIAVLDLVCTTKCRLLVVPGGKGQDHAPAGFGGEAASPKPAPPVRTLSMRQLTGRQRDILAGIRRGEPNKQMARRLNISEATVKAHVRSLLLRLGAGNRTQAAITLFDDDETGIIAAARHPLLPSDGRLSG